MPSNLIDDFLQGLDPIDAATLLAGIRNSVPLGMMFRSGELNEGHDAELARRRGPAAAPAAPTIDPAESNRRAQMEFEMQYPDPRIRELLIAEMLKESRNPYSATTATRRRDFEEAPMSAQQYMSAAPKKKKFANGGAIDFTIPDMQDGGRFIPDPQPYNKGGGVKKTLDQMMAEMAQKGTKVADKPDLARRGFLGLGKASDFPLAKLDTKALEKMQSELKGAPTITEKSVTIDPGKGAAKSTLKSLSETPMSRREVLKSTAGQVLRGVLPKGLMPDVGDMAKQISDITTPIAPTKSSIPAMMAAAIKAGMNEDEAVAHVASQFTKPPRFGGLMAKGEDPAEYLIDHLERLHGNISEPYINYSPEATGAVRPSKAFQELIDRETESMKPLQLKPIMRELKSVDEKMYSNLIKAAKDRSMASVEDLLSYPGVDPSVVERWMKGELKSLPPSYRDKLDYDY
jgi:hypothetical protein